MADNPDKWNQGDAVRLRAFIADNPKFLRVLGKRRPKIEGATMEARAVTGSDVNGFLAAIEVIEELQQDPMPNSDNPGFIQT